MFQEKQHNQTVSSTIKCIISEFLNPFNDLQSEYMLLKQLKSKDQFDSPSLYTINHQISEILQNREPQLSEEHIRGSIMPIEFQLRKIMESDSGFENVVTHMEILENRNERSHFVNSNLWKQKKLTFQGKCVVPIFLYFDDFGVNNPLGPHCSSVCAGYYCLPTMPNFLLSKLDNIFVATIFKSSDIKDFGNNSALHPIIKSLKILETKGITILNKKKEKTILFTLGLILGDNLGLNSIMGFTMSFSSQYFCRVCKRTNIETKTDVHEHIDCLRNQTNYNADLLIPDKDRIKKTGLKEDSIFNTLHDFHVIDNYVFDIMHDLLEGIFHYEFCHILRYFIETKKYFNLETLNYRKQHFSYGESEIKNRGLPIQWRNLLK